MEYGSEGAAAYGAGEMEPIESSSGREAEPQGETQVFGDHILVNKVKIKNEPKLIAQAIRTMLSKDES